MSYIKPTLFTVILHTYFRPDLLKESVKAILNQTYDNLEVILIDDGSTEETKEQLYEYQNKDKRVKLLHFKENQFTWDDPQNIIEPCFNTALEMSTGDYIWHQDDDDIIAEDYLEKMVDLFQGHTECISAAGLTVSMDKEGNIWENEISNRKSNYRSRYMPGHILALEFLRGKGPLFASPGQIFSFKRDVLLKYGGFHRAYEFHHLYGVLPFGITGFDETAYFYWRRHEGQMNIALSSRGWVGTKELFSMIDDHDIENKWKVFGDNTARNVVRKIKKHQVKIAANWFVINLYSLRINGAIKILRDTWRHLSFWSFLPGRLWQENRKFFTKAYSFPIRVMKYILRPVINPIRRRLSKSSSLIAKD